jgi:DNA-binding LacI/PurR family transcriptional regulator
LINYDLIQLCIDNGLICGRDYQLVCYDNLKEKNIQLPPGIPEITSIDYSRTAAAQTAAKLLIHSVQNPHTIGCQTIKFPTSLRIKESAFTNRKELITL